jgi:hypothetical protein
MRPTDELVVIAERLGRLRPSASSPPASAAMERPTTTASAEERLPGVAG